MTTTPHGQVPEALRLAHIFDNPLPPEWPDMVAAAAELRRQHARIAELEAQIEALSGAQALSAAPRTPTVEQVEDEVSMGHGAWDMVDPQELIGAVLRLSVAASPTPPALSAAPAEQEEAAQRLRKTLDIDPGDVNDPLHPRYIAGFKSGHAAGRRRAADEKGQLK